MYRIPRDLDLTSVVGEFTTYIAVGQFDLHFYFGKVIFGVMSQVDLVRNGEVIGRWDEGNWPDPQFYEIMNVNVVKYEVPNDRLIVLYFENGIEMHLKDDSDQYECMEISIEGNPNQWII